MKKLILIYLLIVSFRSYSQKELCGDYFLACCKSDFSEQLSLYSNYMFEYFYSSSSGNKETNKGFWKIEGDTLLLYNYKGKQTIDTLSGNESITELKDSIVIHFYDTLKKINLLPPGRLSINGNCIKVIPKRNATFAIPKMEIKTISMYSCIYLVKNKTANDIQIIYRYIRNFPSRLDGLEKCILKEKTIIPFGCDGNLDIGHKMQKK